VDRGVLEDFWGFLKAQDADCDECESIGSAASSTRDTAEGIKFFGELN
jgi:hypothetical protein